MHQVRWEKWICTKCSWEGDYDMTNGVTYRGIDWQHCRVCGAIVIPKIGSTEFLGFTKKELEIKNKSS